MSLYVEVTLTLMRIVIVKHFVFCSQALVQESSQCHFHWEEGLGGRAAVSVFVLVRFHLLRHRCATLLWTMDFHCVLF